MPCGNTTQSYSTYLAFDENPEFAVKPVEIARHSSMVDAEKANKYGSWQES